MKNVFRLKKDDIILAAIDFQEKLLPAISGREAIEKNAIKLAKGLEVFGVPKIVTTQYAKGLGQTVEPVAEALGDFEPDRKSVV